MQGYIDVNPNSDTVNSHNSSFIKTSLKLMDIQANPNSIHGIYSTNFLAKGINIFRWSI